MSTDKQVLYVRFNEFNDNEGETWSRFIPTDDPLIPQMKEYLSILDDCDDGYLSEAYWFTQNRVYTQTEVDLLLEEDACGYMDQFGVANINPNFKFEYTDPEDVFEDLYKLAWAV